MLPSTQTPRESWTPRSRRWIGVVLLWTAVGVACVAQGRTNTTGTTTHRVALDPEQAALVSEWEAALDHARQWLGITRPGEGGRSINIHLALDASRICRHPTGAWRERYQTLGCYKAIEAWLYPFTRSEWTPTRACGAAAWCRDPELEGVLVATDRSPFNLRQEAELNMDEVRAVRLFVIGGDGRDLGAPAIFLRVDDKGLARIEHDTIAVLRWYDEFIGYTREVNEAPVIARQIDHRKRVESECVRYGIGPGVAYSCGSSCRPSVCFGGSCSRCTTRTCRGSSTYCVMSRVADVKTWSDTSYGAGILAIPTVAVPDTVREFSLLEASLIMSLATWRLGGRAVLLDASEVVRYARFSGPGHFLHGYVVR